MKIVHRNLLLILLSDPLDHAGALNNNRSLVDLKETWAHGQQLQQVQLPVMCISWAPMKEYSPQI